MRDTTLRDSLAALAASITTDTGAFEPGHRDFSRYMTPGLCVAAAVTTGQVLRNSLAGVLSFDTLQNRPDEDTLPRQVMATARMCGAKFTLAKTSVADLGSLFDLALLAADDSLAAAALARWTASVPPAMRDTIEQEALKVYLGVFVDGLHAAEPARQKLAEDLVDQIDREGDTSSRLAAHQRLLQFAVMKRDERLAYREGLQITTLVRPMVATPRQMATAGLDLYYTYTGLMLLTYTVAPDSIRPIAELARQTLGQYPSDVVCRAWFSHCRTVSLNQMQDWLERRALISMTSGNWSPGVSVARLHAKFWFPAKDAEGRESTRDTVFPVPGKFTVIIHTQPDCQIDADWLFFQSVCHIVPEWISKFIKTHDLDNVAIVVLARTHDGAFLSGAHPEVADAERIRWYFQDFQQLPVTVAVQVAKADTLPAPDGRIVGRERDTTVASFWGLHRDEYGPYIRDDAGVIVVDGTGRLIYKDGFEWEGMKVDIGPAVDWSRRSSSAIPESANSYTPSSGSR